MFDFEKLEVYAKAKTYRLLVQKFLLRTPGVDNTTRNQLRRAALSIPLNIAEGSGRRSKADKRNFFVVARGSTSESVSIFDLLKDEELINDEGYKFFYARAEELSKMLYAMIQKLE